MVVMLDNSIPPTQSTLRNVEPMAYSRETSISFFWVCGYNQINKFTEGNLVFANVYIPTITTHWMNGDTAQIGPPSQSTPSWSITSKYTTKLVPLLLPGAWQCLHYLSLHVHLLTSLIIASMFAQTWPTTVSPNWLNHILCICTFMAPMFT